MTVSSRSSSPEVPPLRVEQMPLRPQASPYASARTPVIDAWHYSAWDRWQLFIQKRPVIGDLRAVRLADPFGNVLDPLPPGAEATYSVDEGPRLRPDGQAQIDRELPAWLDRLEWTAQTSSGDRETTARALAGLVLQRPEAANRYLSGLPADRRRECAVDVLDRLNGYSGSKPEDCVTILRNLDAPYRKAAGPAFFQAFTSLRRDEDLQDLVDRAVESDKLGDSTLHTLILALEVNNGIDLVEGVVRLPRPGPMLGVILMNQFSDDVTERDWMPGHPVRKGTIVTRLIQALPPHGLKALERELIAAFNGAWGASYLEDVRTYQKLRSSSPDMPVMLAP